MIADRTPLEPDDDRTQSPSPPDGLLKQARRTLRAQPVLHPRALLERLREGLGGFPADPDHLPHLRAALEWLEAAQDGTPDDGFCRAYGMVWDPYFQVEGWQPSYPETTGYIIPTLYEAARVLSLGRLADRATRAALWEIRLQLPSGAVQGGVVGEGSSPAIFNTGQVILGWLSAHAETGDSRFETAIRRACEYMVGSLGPDGIWTDGNSRFALRTSTLYTARASWALAEAGTSFGEPRFAEAAHRHLRMVARRQADNGWFPDCCLNGPEQPLLHTLAYAVRGLLEGGRVLEDETLVAAGARAARALAERVRADGWMPGRFGADWSGASTWSCLTGQAQMVNNWVRLYQVTGDRAWLGPVSSVIAFLKTTQNRASQVAGLRGGIKGSSPVTGDYGRYEVLSWATKYFVDALLRDLQVRTGATAAEVHAHRLA